VFGVARVITAALTKGNDMTDYNVIYIDEDGRNASPRPLAQDNRVRTMGSPARTGLVVPPSTRPTVIQSAPRQVYGAPSYGAPGYGAPSSMMYYHPPAQGAASTVLGNLTAAELIDMVAQGLAALQPLPGAPAAQGDVETDVENLVLYQSALATHAKRDEQLRTIGAIVSKLVRK